ncbi:MAG: four helix bundle protein [Candidatus Marinimicrobia bacterium]|nr:four helix bundle protein [Candidatus Neomarinimicrobiota bacterium]
MKTNNNKIIYYLTGQADQIRKASRSVRQLPDLKEAWSKRRYIAHFTSKLTDCDGETETWVNFAKDCRYIGVTDYNRLIERNQRVGQICLCGAPVCVRIRTGRRRQVLGNMINKADVFCNK